MPRRSLKILILLIMPAFLTGCAVATTANIVEPDQQAAIRTAMYSRNAAGTDVSVASNTVVQTPNAIVPAAIPTASPLEYAVNAVQTDIPEPISNSSEPTFIATPTPEPTQTPKVTSAPAYTVTPVDNTEAYVYAKSINLRSGPGTDYEIVNEYGQYTAITITGKTDKWYEVEIGNVSGFMLKEYVKLGSPSTPSATVKATQTPKQTATPAATATAEATKAPSSVNNSSLSDDLYLVAKIVYKESGSDGYAAVANVIYNRYKSSKYPNTIQGVCYQSGQFTVVDDSDFATLTPSSGAINAVNDIFTNGNTILPDNVMYFRPSSKGTSWGSRTYYATIGGNNFYY